MTPSELFLARVRKDSSIRVPERYIEGLQGSIDAIEFEPLATRVDGTPGFAVTACIERTQAAFTTPFTHAEAQALAPLLAEFVLAFYTGVRAVLMKKLSDTYVENAGVCEDLVKWAREDWVTMLANGTPYMGTQRRGQLKILFTHTFVLATKALTTSIEIHDTGAGDGKHYDTAFSKFTLPRVPTRTTIQKDGTSMTESIELIEPEEEFLGEETYDMYFKRVCKIPAETDISEFSDALDTGHLTQRDFIRNGEPAKESIWTYTLDFKKPHAPQPYSAPLFEAFYECLEAVALERIKSVFPVLSTHESTLRQLRHWVTKETIGIAAAQDGWAWSYGREKFARIAIEFIVFPEFNGNPATLVARTKAITVTEVAHSVVTYPSLNEIGNPSLVQL